MTRRNPYVGSDPRLLRVIPLNALKITRTNSQKMIELVISTELKSPNLGKTNRSFPQAKRGKIAKHGDQTSTKCDALAKTLLELLELHTDLPC